MNTERLDILARWLESGAPERLGVGRFDMHEWDAQEECGMVCCIGGATIQFFAGGKTEADENLSACAARLLDLDQHFADQLFYPSGNTDGFDATPAQAARVIRHLIATNEIDWSQMGAR